MGTCEDLHLSTQSLDLRELYPPPYRTLLVLPSSWASILELLAALLFLVTPAVFGHPPLVLPLLLLLTGSATLTTQFLRVRRTRCLVRGRSLALAGSTLGAAPTLIRLERVTGVRVEQQLLDCVFGLARVVVEQTREGQYVEIAGCTPTHATALQSKIAQLVRRAKQRSRTGRARVLTFPRHPHTAPSLPRRSPARS